MREKIIDIALDVLVFLVLLLFIVYIASVAYSNYATIQFQQKMILELEYKCGWYIDSDKEKD